MSYTEKGTKMTKRITDEDKEVIRQMYSEGTSLQDIGDSLGEDLENCVSKQTVWYHVQKMGLEAPEDTERLELKALASTILESDPDITIKDLSEKLDSSWQSAKTLMKELGHYSEPVPFVERVNAEKLIELYVVQDKSLADLTEVFPVSEMTISKTLKALGVPMRPKSAAYGDRRREWREEAIVTLGLTTPAEEGEQPTP